MDLWLLRMTLFALFCFSRHGGARTIQTTSSSTLTGAGNGSTDSQSSTTTSALATANATYSIREPIVAWNLSSSPVESEFPPKKTQAGQPSYCNNWYYVSVGDTCENIVSTHAWVTMEEFLQWNPEVDSDCSGLYNDWWVCVGIQPQTVTAAFEYTITPAPIEVPPYTGVYTPTTFPTVNSSFTATPTQPGLAPNCQAFYQAEKGDTCRQVLQYNFLSEAQLFAWNPALEGNCDGLWANYWYCVAAYNPGSTILPTPSTVTTRPSPVPTGQISTCTSWYEIKGWEACDDIVGMFAAFSKTDFSAWNPSVGSSCEGIAKGFFYCVGIPGTPTTRTAPVSSTVTPIQIPMQSGIAVDCRDFWLVSSSDTCDSIASNNDIESNQFFTWNPAVGSSSCDNLVPDSYVCVGVGVRSTTSTVLPSTAGPTAIGASSKTDSSGASVSTPKPVFAGMVKGCQRFYYPQPGEGCWAIANSAGIDLNDFYRWNPDVGTDCQGLWRDYYYCIGIQGPVTTVSGSVAIPT